MRSMDSYCYPEMTKVKLTLDVSGRLRMSLFLYDKLTLCSARLFLSSFFSESLKDLVAMEVDAPADVKNELPTPPASDVGSPTSFSHCGSDSEPDSPIVEDTKVCSSHLNC